jgi:hypothetical protein
MKNKRMENSVTSLVNLYTVVIGVSLSIAVAGAIDINKGLQSLTTSSMALFIAFIVTIFPFFHGALRHLHDTYIENKNEHIKPGALIVDFALLFLHALVFLVLSQLLKKPADFAWLLIGVLIVDVVWGVLTFFWSNTPKKLTPGIRWSIINIFFIGIVALYLIDRNIYLGWNDDPGKLAILISIACSIRSFFDYLWCHDVYFPKEG